MAGLDLSAWCDDMLAQTGHILSAEDASTPGEAHAAAMPVLESPLAVTVPLSDTLTAIDPEDLATSTAAGSIPSSSSACIAAVDSLKDSRFPSDDSAVTPKPWEADRIYAQWVPDIENIVAPVKALRGKQLEPLGCATLFGGLSSERQNSKLFSIDARWHFTCDKKLASVAWSELNFSRPTVHFMDGLDFLQSAEGQNLFTPGQKQSLAQFRNKVDTLYVSSSCRPYAMSRSKRKSAGCEGHEDVRLLDSFFSVVYGRVH